MFSLCGRLPRPMAIGCLNHRYAQETGTPVRLRNGTELRVPQGASLIAFPPPASTMRTLLRSAEIAPTPHMHTFCLALLLATAVAYALPPTILLG